MPIFSQSQLEQKLLQLEAILKDPLVELKPDYGEKEDWILDLGFRKAALNPRQRQWLWYMKLDDQWVDANCGVGEAILITVGRTAGIKRLPVPGDISEWCVYMQGLQLFGPLRTSTLIAQLNGGQLPVDITVWSPCATSWLTPTREAAGIRFTDESGNLINLAQPEHGTQSQQRSSIPQPPPLAANVPSMPPAPSVVPVVPPVVPPPVNLQPPAFGVPIPINPLNMEVIVLNGDLMNRRFTLSEKLSIGREFDNDLILSDQKASRHHAVLQRQNNSALIADLNSSNGTLVNNVEIRVPTILRHGDLILIGETQLQIAIQ